MDGKFGATTEEAVRKFQRDNSMTETGFLMAPELNMLFPPQTENEL